MNVGIRRMEPAEYERWRPQAQREYAADMIASGIAETAASEKADVDFRTLLAQGLDSPGHDLYTVTDDGAPAGVLWLNERDSESGRLLFIYDIRIDEERRGRGLGRAAMAFVEEEARRRGLELCALNVFGSNEPARRLYRSLGWVETAIWMTKRV